MMIDFNGSPLQEDMTDEERHKLEMQCLIEDAVDYISKKIPTDREDLKKIELWAHEAGIDIPREVTSRIDGGMPAKQGPVVKVSIESPFSRRCFDRRYQERDLFLRYHGHKGHISSGIKPFYIEIRNREERLKKIAEGVGLGNLGSKALDKILTQQRKENTDYKKTAIYLR